jgi:dynein heavy chain
MRAAVRRAGARLLGITRLVSVLTPTSPLLLQDNMDNALLQKINKFTCNPDFTPEAVGKVSLAAKGMCMWVRAMEVYGNVAKDVGPKRARLRAAQENVAKKQAALEAAQSQLASVLAKVKALRDK